MSDKPNESKKADGGQTSANAPSPATALTRSPTGGERAAEGQSSQSSTKKEHEQIKGIMLLIALCLLGIGIGLAYYLYKQRQQRGAKNEQ